MKPTIGTVLDTGKALDIDLSRLLQTRLLITANSGGGKSYLLRRTLEQTATKVQQVFLDTEGEFSSLREKFDYVICAPSGADAIATPNTAALLARRLRETRVSAIIDLYELKLPDRRRFVRLFIEEMIDAPKSMWHPLLLGIDEAHIYAPETGKDESEAKNVIIDLQSRGRKRGLCGLLATQRLAKLSKDAAAECQNKLIGLTNLVDDAKRAAEELGMSPKDAIPILRGLDPGQFYAFGPAISKSVMRINVGAVVTTHPEPGDRHTGKPPEPSAKIKAILAELKDLPAEAEQEAHTIADFKRENAQLKRELAAAKKAKPNTAPTKIERIKVPAVGKKAYTGIKQCASEMRKALSKIREIHKAWAFNLELVDKRVGELISTLEQVAATDKPDAVTGGNKPQVVGLKPSPSAWRPPTQTTGNNELPGPQQRIIDAIAWFESIGVVEPEQTAVAFLSGYTVGGGAFNNPRGALRSSGLIDYRGERLALTDTGRASARFPDTDLTTEELQRRVLEKLPGPERKLLQVVLSVYPQDIGDTDLAEKTGYAVGGGAFNNPKGRLRSLGLVTYPASKRVRAADILFLE